MFQEKRGARPLSVAAEKGDVDAINLLLELGAYVNAPDAVGASSLSYAVMNRQKDAVLLLLDKGADVNQQDIFGMTSLFLAVMNGDQDLFHIFVSRGAYLKHSEITVKTILHMAIISPNMNENDRVGMVEAILDAVADDWSEPGIINWPEPTDGGSPLHWAAFHDRVDTIRVLLQRGARLDAKNKDGELPIHVAARTNKVEAFFIMLMKNPDLLNARDDKGRTPIDTARKHGSRNILLALNLRKRI